MASTYSTNLALELIGTGDQAGTWGLTTNTNLGTLIEQAISGYVTQAVSTGADTTITIPNGATGVARNMYIELTGTGGASTNLIVPANKKLYFIFNNTASGQVTVKVSGQTGVSVPNKAKMILVSNGTDIVDATNYIGNISAASANITTLTSASATITNLLVTSASITTLTNNPTLSAGTANGVLYLNGSKVATSGSALVFDGTNLNLNSGTAVGATSGGSVTAGVFAARAPLSAHQTAAGVLQYSANETTLRSYGATGVTGALVFNLGAGGSADAEYMRLTSTGLGIGTTSPGYKLDVNGQARLGGSTGLVFGVGTAFAASQAEVYSTSTTPMGLGTTGAAVLRLYTNSTLQATLDTSGNLGLGVTPSAWNSAHKVIDIGTFGAVDNEPAVNGFNLVSNGYYNASNQWIYKNTAAASLLRLNEGGFKFFTAASGTAGNQIALTQAMTLDSSGNLGLGVTPSAWASSWKVFQSQGGFVGSNATSGYFISNNSYSDGTNWRRVSAEAASQYLQSAGAHSWYTAGSSTAGSTITFTTAMVLDASGNLGLGATSITAIGNGYTTQAVQGANGAGFRLYQSTNERGRAYVASNAFFVESVTSIPLVFSTDGTERARITSGGDLLVGTSTAVNARLQVDSGSSGLYGYFNSTNTNGGYVSFASSGTAHGDIGTAAQVVSGGATTDFGINARGSRNLIFGTNNTERARITSGGELLVGVTSISGNIYGSNTGSLFASSSSAGFAAGFRNSSASGTIYGIGIQYTGQSPNGTGNEFLLCEDSGPTIRAAIRSNGGLANYQSNNVDLSDARTKNSITPAASMWDKIGALEIVTYKYNDQTHDDVNVGVIAQQVEAVEPVWVDADGFGETPEDGVPLKTVYTKDITFAAIKALQEAMSRIEALEAKVAALESN